MLGRVYSVDGKVVNLLFLPVDNVFPFADNHPMKLSDYIAKMGLSRAEFSERSGIPLSSVYRLLDEPGVIPEGTNIARIIRATKGEVGVLDIVNERGDESK